MVKEEKTYECVCGKVFDNSQKFNGHKTQCKIYQSQKYGGLEHYHEARHRAAKESGRVKHEKYLLEQQYKNNEWVNEQHRCEKCGKVMTTYFGSGRFCSRSCANSRIHSDETKNKIGQKSRGTHLNDDTKQKISKSLLEYHCNLKIVSEDVSCDCVNKENNNKRRKKPNAHKKNAFVYTGNPLPIILREKRERGYQSRDIVPYSEQFWKAVLDENNVSYQYNIPVWKPGPGNYRLDFLINGNIDLEIDGKIHERLERKEKDKERTAYLENKGYIVYRIKWVDPITENKKAIVNQQIDDLFAFLNIPRIK